ncbi:patatin-like phospholipase family protein [Flammeovirga agarivorans]|uniref:PNPLA domain-containing protein n=1 Tax=Flammeovirga agarivorans TaxID=2726742 RepID=A0A7X8SH23_9BACT|nr:patatin-like phospholipase family protein [Flammeovirga agarivorans]NLR90116.1 hypothetical protein [Flammeovirga agarivorans]
MRTLQILFILIFSFQSLFCWAQNITDNHSEFKQEVKNRKTVGLVLSGGGAKGIAHITVIKVLEEYGIPIDYITGTSMGAIVGGFYAAGYTTDEMITILSDPEFQDWVNGKVNTEDQYYFGRQSRGAEWINFNIELDSIYGFSWNPTIVPDGLLNYNLSARLYKKSKEINYDFDNLDIPFRAVAADVFERKAIVIDHGPLEKAVRASMAVPLVFRPVKIDGKYLYDGGIYNNIPVDVMKEEFNPDMVIAVNLGAHDMLAKYPENDEELIKGNILKYIVMNNVYPKELDPERDIFLGVPVDDYSAADFTPVDSLLAIGDRYARTMIDSVVDLYGHNQPKVKPKDSNFDALFDPDEEIITRVELGDNLTFGQRVFVRNIVKPKRRKQSSINELYDGYSMLLSNNYFSNVDAQFLYDSIDNTPSLLIDVTPNKKFKLGVGGNIASRSIGQFYLNGQFNVFTKSLNTVRVSAMAGTFYSSIKAEVESLYARELPFSLGAEYVLNRWNYGNAKELIFQPQENLSIYRADNYAGGKMSFPTSRKTKLIGFGGYFWNKDSYDQIVLIDLDSNNSQVGIDLVGSQKLEGWTTGVAWEANSLNRKTFATTGRHFKVSGKYIWGDSDFNIYIDEPYQGKTSQDWYTIQAQYEQYFPMKWFTLGVRGHALWSNYEASITTTTSLANAPAYYPLLDSRSLFTHGFRGPRFFAGGLKLIKSFFTPNLNLFLEGHFFTTDVKYANSSTIFPNTTKNSFFKPSTMDYALAGSIVYTSPIGPVSFSVNHYNEEDYNLMFLFNIGILLYHEKALEK